MAAILIRNLDEETKDRLRMLAAMHRRSLEAEVREILRYQVMHAPRLVPESDPPPAPGRELRLAADHDSDSEQDSPHASRAPRGMDPREAILTVNRELEKLGMGAFALPEDLPLG